MWEGIVGGACGRSSFERFMWEVLVGGACGSSVESSCGRDSWVGLVEGTHVGGARGRDLCGRGLCGRDSWEGIMGGACGRVHYCSLAPNVRMVESGHKTRAHVEAHVGEGRILNQGAHQTFCE